MDAKILLRIMRSHIMPNVIHYCCITSLTTYVCSLLDLLKFDELMVLFFLMSI